MILRRWVFAQLISAGTVLLVLIVWINPSSAMQLKDIRIGEYDSFTRIVFESDADLPTEQIASSNPNQISIVFTDTRPAFIRKIPVDRARLIEDIKIISEKNRLSITLHFSKQYARFESFGLRSPPRLALDVYWQPLGDQPEAPVATTGTIELKGESRNETALSEDSETTSSTYAFDKPVLDLSADETKLPKRDENPASAEKGESSSNEKYAVNEENQTPLPTVKQRLDASPASADGQAAGEGAAHANSLQYYLVISLVIITIVILLLLIITLVQRHHWDNDKKSLNANEYLQKQDEQIASINARVQEQLKRYDEV